MCGIAGVVELTEINTKLNLVDSVKLMLQLTKHRGPDNTDLISFDNICLGHNRLSILDLSNISNQPFTISNYTIVFNGEIYNFKDLKNLLERKHSLKFKSTSDTEVLLQGYIVYGSDITKMLLGMWSFAIYDSDKKKLFCSRDPFGIKPFYYYKNDSNFYFCSEIKGILPFLKEKKIKNDLIETFLLSGKTDYNSSTFFKEIFKLDPGHNLEIDLSTATLNFWSYFDYKLNLNSSDFESSFKNSIKRHTITDVPYCITFSGGLDSGSILYALSNLNLINSHSFIAFTFGNKLFNNSDLQYSTKVCKELDVNQNFTIFSNLDTYEEIKKLVWHQDEPFDGLSIFYQYLIMRDIKRKKFKVVLSGQGADELLFGYSKYLIVIIDNLIKKSSFLHFLKTTYLLIKNNDSISLKNYTAAFVIRLIPKIADYIVVFRNLRYIKWNILKKFNFYSEFVKNSKINLENLRVKELLNTNLQSLLRFEDRNSMAFSIESRVPFLDKDVFQSICALDINDLVKNGNLKNPIREFKFIPKFLSNRKSKLGFDDPSVDFIQSNKNKIADDIKSSKIILKYITPNFFNKFYSLPNDVLMRFWILALWEKVVLKNEK